MAISKNWTIVFISLLILGAGLTHGLNLFHYPYYESDEGTYLSQAYSFLTQGKLSPYTYTYDHAPFGWIFLSLWIKLTGGFSTFGFSVNSGRVFVLILNLISSLFIYNLVLRLTRNWLLAAVSVILFTFSPLAIYYHRRLLLDNIMVFWLMFSLLLSFISQTSKNLVISGLLFGLAVVTKESALVFIPAFYYLIYLKTSQKFKKIFLWNVSFSFPLLLYFIYALSRGELFPYGSFLGGDYPHVSLISTFLEQVNRPPDLNIFSLVKLWYRSDPILLLLGTWSIFVNLYYSLKHQENRIILIFNLLYIFFLFRGGIVLEFYIIPLLPFFVISIVMAIYSLINSFSPQFLVSDMTYYPFILIFSLMLFDLFYFGSRSKGDLSLFFSDQTTPQIEAVRWIQSQSQPAFYITDNYAYVDLYTHNSLKNQYHSYWKIDRDPQIGVDILKNDPNNIDYLMATPQTITDLTYSQLPLSQSAFRTSIMIKDFSKDRWSVYIYKNQSSYQ